MQAHEPRAIELLRGAGRSADRGCGDRREDRRHLRRVPALRLSARHRPAPSRRPSGQPKAMRLMREHDLTVRPRRRWVATTDSNHDGPIFPNLAKGLLPTAPNELWVADITYIRDHQEIRLPRRDPRRLVAPRRWIRDRPLDRRAPHDGSSACCHRGPPAAARVHSSLGPGFPVCCRQVKTLKVEAVYLTEYETFTDVIADLPHFID